MNRTGLGLAIGAGYLLGRTKKLKLAFAVGTFVAGKKLNLSPTAIVNIVNQQLRDNPQFKEIGDQLRQDLRGVGRAASGAMVERQLDSLADRLHGRTAEVRDQLAGVVPDTGGLGLGDERDDEEDAETEDEDRRGRAEDDDKRGRDEEDRDKRGRDEEDRDKRGRDEEDRDKRGRDEEDRDKRGRDEEDRDKGPARKAPGQKAPAKQAAKKAPAKKTAAKKAPAKKAAQGRAAVQKTTGRAPSKGGADR